MALLNNPVARGKVESLYRQILGVWDDERKRMNAAGCDLCGSNDKVGEAANFEHLPVPPKLCLLHRSSWGVSCAHNKTFVTTDLKFASWLASMLKKEAKKHATQ